LLLDLLEELSPLPFVKFMELCLYHPEYGYYARGNLPGKQGDFVTAPCIHPVFGATIARQILEMWEVLGSPKDFLILEAGAGQGYLALDILTYLRKKGYSFKYAIIEPFPAIRAVQEEVLQDFLDDVSWYTTPKDVPFFQGVFLANELFDAFPVHLVEKREGELHEVWVEVKGGHIREFYEKFCDPRVLRRVYRFFPYWCEGYRTEVCLTIEDFYKELAQKLIKGFFFIIDYGYPRQDYYSPERTCGTLVCYYRHRLVDNPYLAPGHTDISCHVDFTLLRELGDKYGLLTLGFTQQGPFLVSCGIDRVLLEVSEGSYRDLNAVKRLILPEGLGGSHWVLVQGRLYSNIFEVMLSGFRLSNRTNLLMGDFSSV